MFATLHLAPRHDRSPFASMAAAALALALVALPTIATAVPVAIQLEGHLRTVGDGPVADGEYGVGLSLYAGADDEVPLYTENVLAVAVKAGYFAVELGTADPTKKLDSALFADGGAAFFGVKVGGEPEMSRVPLRPVPYAVHAEVAANALGLDCSACVNASAIAAGAVTDEALAIGAVGDKHVAFLYASSASKGGAALEAAHAVLADSAKHADNATTAQVAEVAKQANSATTADEANSATKASSLQCTGCVDAGHIADGAVGLAKLAPDAKAAFLPTAGGTLEGDVDFAWHRLAKPRIFAQAVADMPCDADHAGGLFFDPASKRLAFCDGGTVHKLALCSPGVGCPAPQLVDCGASLVDVCGDATCGDTKGTKCGGGEVCTAGKCIAALASCKAWKVANPAAVDGQFLIDPDGDGGHPPVDVFCDMKNGGYTLVLNVYDSAEDDAPNDISLPPFGWQQVKAGVWNKGVTKTTKQIGPGVSSAFPPSAIRSMWKGGASALKMCFVSKDGSVETCRSSDNGGANLTITAAPEAVVNNELRLYRASVCGDGVACNAAYTYGRLSGLPGTRNDYNYAAFTQPGYCIPRTNGDTGTFGNDGTGLCEHSSVNENRGVWHGWGCGISYRPDEKTDSELGVGSCGGANPSDLSWGFRVYVK